jgi:hypothetical protein
MSRSSDSRVAGSLQWSLIRRLRKNADLDALFGKAFGALGHAEIFEPVCNLLHRGHQGQTVACLSFGPRGREFTPISSAIARLLIEKRARA